MTKIPWTEKTWNPVVGCSKIAVGCKNCYAERMAARLQQMAIAEYETRKDTDPTIIPQQIKGKGRYVDVIDQKGRWNGHVSCCEERLSIPLHWRKPRKIFVCSMSDLFHPSVPFGFIEKVIAVIEQCPQHDFQILTKRPQIMLDYFNSLGKRFELSCCQNLWLGTSISTQADADKNIPILLQIPAAVRFVSLEPMLEPIDLRCLIIGPRRRCVFDCLRASAASEDGVMVDTKIKPLDWAIIGCESGPGARLCSLEDIRDAVRQCKEANVPVFVKQVPVNGKCNKNLDEWPVDLRIQEYPNGNEKAKAT